MGTTAPQKLQIVYNSVTFGTGNEDIYRILDGTFEYSAQLLTGTLSFNVVLFATSYAELITRTGALKDALRDRRKRCQININGSAWYDFNPSANINKNLHARCTQVKSALFTGRSQEYRIEIDIDLPPPSATNGRIEKSVQLHYKPNRERILTMTNMYRSTSGATAYANFQADESYWTSVQTFFASGVTWKLMSEDINSDDAINNIEFEVTRVYEELIEKVKIMYGDLTMGPSGTYRIIDGWSFNRVRATKGAVTFKVRVYAADEGAMATVCTALEEGMVEKRKVLKLYYGATLQRNFTANNIYVDALGQSTGEEGEWFGATTRDYRVSVEVDLPPKNADGITEKLVRLSYGPQRRIRIEIAAQYNSVEGTGAKALMTASWNTYCSGILTTLGESGEYNIIDEGYELIPAIDNQVEVRRTYEQILLSETSSVFNDGDIIGMTVNVEIGKNFPGDRFPSSSSGASGDVTGQSQVPGSGGSSSIGVPKRLIDIRTTANMSILKTADIMTTYTNKLRDYLVSYTKTISGVSLIALVREAPAPGPTESSLSITLEFKGAINGTGQIIRSEMETSIQLNDGKIIVGAWDGTKFGKYEVDTKAIRERTIVETIETVNGGQEPPIHEPSARGTGARWVRKGIGVRHSYLTLGNPDNGAENFDITTLVTSTTQEYIEDPKATVTTLAGK